MGMAIAVKAVRGVVACRLRRTDAPRQMNVSRTKRSIGSLSDTAAAIAAPRPRTAAPLWSTTTPWTPVVAASIAAAILAALPAARAQDAPAAGQSASAPAPVPASPAASSSSAAASTDTGSNSSPAAGQAAATPAAGQSPGKSDPVCFKLTGHCVDGSKTPKAGAATAKTGATDKKPLNLTAPDVRTVVPEEELKEPLPTTDQITEVQEAQTVSVKGDEGVPPDVPGGFGAIWWAMNHPSQAWRIFTPAE